MSDIRVTAWAVLALLVSVPAAAQTTLYVNASTGDDAVPRAANSVSSPWRTIGRAAWGSMNRETPNPAEAARAGDTVVVAAGSYSLSAPGRARNIPLYNPVNSGTPGQPVIFRASGHVSLASPVYRGPVIGAFERSHIVWDGFFIDEANVNTTPDTGPVVVWASSHVTVQNLEIRGTFVDYVDNHNGIRLEAADDSVVRGNLIHGFGNIRSGQRLRPRNAACVMLYDSNRNVIEHNELSECGVGVFVKGVHLGRGQSGTIVRYNVMHTMGLQSTGVGVTLQTSSNAKVYQNVFRDLDVAVEIEALAAGRGHPVNDIIANNTIHNVAQSAFWLRGNQGLWENVRLYNNIVSVSRRHVLWAEGVAEPGDISFEHNVYHSVAGGHANLRHADHSLSAFRKRFGTDRVPGESITSDPRFADAGGRDFRLCTGARQPAASCTGASPALSLGVDILDLDEDGSTTDTISAGAHIGNTVTIGRVKPSADGPAPR